MKFDKEIIDVIGSNLTEDHANNFPSRSYPKDNEKDEAMLIGILNSYNGDNYNRKNFLTVAGMFSMVFEGDLSGEFTPEFIVQTIIERYFHIAGSKIPSAGVGLQSLCRVLLAMPHPDTLLLWVKHINLFGSKFDFTPYAMPIWTEEVYDFDKIAQDGRKIRKSFLTRILKELEKYISPNIRFVYFAATYVSANDYDCLHWTSFEYLSSKLLLPCFGKFDFRNENVTAVISRFQTEILQKFFRSKFGFLLITKDMLCSDAVIGRLWLELLLLARFNIRLDKDRSFEDCIDFFILQVKDFLLNQPIEFNWLNSLSVSNLDDWRILRDASTAKSLFRTMKTNLLPALQQQLFSSISIRSNNEIIRQHYRSYLSSVNLCELTQTKSTNNSVVSSISKSGNSKKCVSLMSSSIPSNENNDLFSGGFSSSASLSRRQSSQDCENTEEDSESESESDGDDGVQLNDDFSEIDNYDLNSPNLNSNVNLQISRNTNTNQTNNTSNNGINYHHNNSNCSYNNNNNNNNSNNFLDTFVESAPANNFLDNFIVDEIQTHDLHEFKRLLFIPTNIKSIHDSKFQSVFPILCIGDVSLYQLIVICCVKNMSICDYNIFSDNSLEKAIYRVIGIHAQSSIIELKYVGLFDENFEKPPTTTCILRTTVKLNFTPNEIRSSCIFTLSSKSWEFVDDKSKFNPKNYFDGLNARVNLPQQYCEKLLTRRIQWNIIATSLSNTPHTLKDNIFTSQRSNVNYDSSSKPSENNNNISNITNCRNFEKLHQV
jgi:hypothetical protein